MAPSEPWLSTPFMALPAAVDVPVSLVVITRESL